MSGWLLKKKRKRMQGWAKRWSRMIHIDSGTMLYHLKALSEDEYSDWIEAMKKAKHSNSIGTGSESVHRLKREASVKRPNRNSWLASSTSDLDQLKQIMNSMNLGFAEIKEQIESIRAQSETSQKSPSSSSRERQSSIDNHNGTNSSGGAKFRLGKFSPGARSKNRSDRKSISEWKE
ncbi:hypothetical protein BGZ65_003889 [Modicella reniformis]|uniref:PH domain-containing protein n=1 Tax=Modicella reniformis TaxID=1440133 RepID=A0A9P6IZ13_9FUNG|nr:hypothetical protein BGZ65_003889 [Modicella reniformis]